MASSAPDSALASEAMEAFVDDDFASAFELYTKLVDAAPTRASAWIHRSATLLKLDRPAEALEDAERAVALDPDNASSSEVVAEAEGVQMRLPWTWVEERPTARKKRSRVRV